MVDNLTEESEKKLKELQDKFKGKTPTVQETALISIAESMLILAEKIGRHLP